VFIPDPLLEEAAFLAAAVREGSLPARKLVTLAHARVAEMNAFRFDLADALHRAGEIDRLVAARTNMPLAGVPFVIAGHGGERLRAALEQAGAIHLMKLDTLLDAADAVRQGIAAIAMIADAKSETIAACRIHALMTSESDAAFLARSCRDLALAVDAAAGGRSNDVLCRPLTSEVGRGLGSLAIALLRGEGGCLPSTSSRLNSHCDGRGIAFATVDMADLKSLDRFDAIVSQSLPQRDSFAAWIWLPPSERNPEEGLCIAARSSDIAVRIGSALDAALLIEA
jgi:hypothetical protein